MTTAANTPPPSTSTRLGELALRVALLCSAMSLLMGCPSTPPRPSPPADPTSAKPTAATAQQQPTTTAASARAAITGSWSVKVTSSAPAINPAMFDTPEKKAKVFFDHQARVVGSKIVVTHHTLGRDFPLKDDADATRLDQLVRSVDWEAMKKKVAAEESSEGATEFRFTIIRDDVSHEFVTTNVEKYAELTDILDMLKAAVGQP